MSTIIPLKAQIRNQAREKSDETLKRKPATATAPSTVAQLMITRFRWRLGLRRILI